GPHGRHISTGYTPPTADVPAGHSSGEEAMRALLCVGMLFIAATIVGADEEKVPLDKVPKAVIDSVKKRFPKAALVGASTEKVGDKTIFEIEIKEAGKTIDVTLTPEGAITMIEKEIAITELPKGAKEAVEKKYPKATWKLVEAVIKVEDGKEKLAYYEAHLEG